MKSIAVITLTAAGLLIGGTAAASEELAKENKCTTCHAPTEKKKGPSVAQIAKDTKGKSVDEVVAAVKGDDAHKRVKASDDDLKKIVAWMMK
ncbi:MAG: c-type cytochrome [Betaproteobacteria bacterium]